MTEQLDQVALALCVHENYVETWVRAGAGMEGGRVEQLDGATIVSTGLPLLLFNQVFVVDSGATPEQTAASIRVGVGILRDSRRRFSVTLRGGFDDAYQPLTTELGLGPLDSSPWMPGMALHPLPAAGGTPLPHGHEIRAIVDAQGLSDHADVLAAGFGMPREWAAAFAVEALLRMPGITFYVGYQDDVAVTAGLGSRTGRTIGVYNIATVESARRRGLGAAMTMRVVDDGAAAGCDVAILQASEMGQPVYERLGFRTVVEYFGHVDPRAED